MLGCNFTSGALSSSIRDYWTEQPILPTIMMDFGVDVQVVHIPGTENAIVDALSHLLFQVASTLHPGLNITIFQPPVMTGSPGYRKWGLGSQTWPSC